MEAFKQISEWGAERVACGVATINGLERTTGDAFSKFELASVTKAIFSLAVLVAIEEGSLDINAPSGPEGATIGNLLSHSSGLSMRADNDHSLSIVTKPGQKRIYSNQGFDLLAKELASATGIDARTYFHEAVAEPLGLKDTEIYGSVAYQGRSTVSDLLTIGLELLSPKLISSQTLRQATTPHLPALSGVLPGFGSQSQNSWGLGFEIKGTKTNHWTAPGNSPRTFGHFGQTGTFLWVDPLAETCCVALTNRDFGPWAHDVWPKFSQSVISEVS